VTVSSRVRSKVLRLRLCVVAVVAFAAAIAEFDTHSFTGAATAGTTFCPNAPVYLPSNCVKIKPIHSHCTTDHIRSAPLRTPAIVLRGVFTLRALLGSSPRSYDVLQQTSINTADATTDLVLRCPSTAREAKAMWFAQPPFFVRLNEQISRAVCLFER
jgi:hypothetical protein